MTPICLLNWRPVWLFLIGHLLVETTSVHVNTLTGPFLTVLPPYLLLLASSAHIASASPSSSNRFERRKWCPWSEWTRCAPVSCRTGLTDLPSVLYSVPSSDLTGFESDDMDDTTSHCVIQPTSKSKRVVWTAVVQYVSRGHVRTRTPVKRRIRTCACSSFSFLNIVSLWGRDQCVTNTREVQCDMCGVEEPIYISLSPDNDTPSLPFCDPFTHGAFQLYKVLGGVAGAVVLILFVVWLTRILCKLSSRSERHGDDRDFCHPRRFGGEAGGARSGHNAAENNTTDVIHGLRTTNDAPPPDYKDVVGLLPQVQVVTSESETVGMTHFLRGLHKPRVSRSNPPAPYRMSCCDDDALPSASSSQTLASHPPGAETPPPPSYHAVVAGCQQRGIRLLTVDGDGDTQDSGVGENEQAVNDDTHSPWQQTDEPTATTTTTTRSPTV